MRPTRVPLAAPFLLIAFFLAAAAGALEKKETEFSRGARAKGVQAEVLEALSRGEAQDLIVELDGGAVLRQAHALRAEKAVAEGSAEILEMMAREYASVKQSALSSLRAEEYETLRDYSHLPLVFLRFRSRAALERLLERPDVVAAYLDEPAKKLLNQSLPLIGQPSAAAAGHRGTGTTVAVLDGGVDYTRAAFGFCTSPGVPAGCKVVAYQDFADPDGTLDDPDLHGTNVSGIVLGVAPDTRIAGLDVFNVDTTSSSIVISGINWAISNRATFNIIAMNLSLGGTPSTTVCSATSYTAAFANARAAGILPVVASGNDGLTDQISTPGCAPGAVSVGAVYDSDFGNYPGSCTGSVATGANKVACFSNSASFLTLLAPGALISAAGVSQAGTSQASPHVAGAAAVLKALFPSDSLDQTTARMTSTGVLITDSRNGIVKPRVNLQAATGALPLTCPSQALACPGTLSGVLETADCPTGQRNDGQFTDSYEFTGTAGQTVTIDMSSSQFDTFLFLVNPSGQIAESNDDISGLNVNSRMVFTLNASGTWRIEASSFARGATGIYSLSISGCSGGTPSVCTPGPNTLCLSGGRFRVQTQWSTPQGQSGAGMAVALSSDTGYFWFFSSTNVEMVVKVLNACSFAQRIWVFAGGLTDVAVTMTVTDTANGTVKTYTNPQQTAFVPIQDTSAFATCP